jgi:hypothetical protein
VENSGILGIGGPVGGEIMKGESKEEINMIKVLHMHV